MSFGIIGGVLGTSIGAGTVGGALGSAAIGLGASYLGSQFNKPDEVQRTQISTLTPDQESIASSLSGLALGQAPGVPGIGQPGATFGGPFATGGNQFFDQAFQLAGQIPQNLQNMLGTSGNFLQNFLNPKQGQFDAITENAMNVFQNETVPFLENRFGGGNQVSSSAFNRALGRAGRDLSTSIASQIAPHRLQANRDLQSLALLGGEGAGQLARFGGMQQGIDEQLRLGQERQFNLQNPFNSPAVALGQGILSGSFFDTARDKIAGDNSFGNAVTGALGSLGNAAIGKWFPQTQQPAQAINQGLFSGGGGSAWGSSTAGLGNLAFT